MKKLTVGILVTLLSILLVATSIPAMADEVDLSDKKVGLAMHFMMDDYAKFFVQAFTEVMDEAGVSFEIADANANPVTQLDNVTNFLNLGVDCMVIVPFDENAVRDQCNVMAEEGIPIVAVTYMPGVNVVATISGGDYENGYLAGELFVEKLGGEGKIVIFDTPIVAFRMSERIRGLRAACSGTNIEISDIKTSVTPESFMNITIDMLNADPDITGIFGNFANPTIGAGEALKELSRDDIILAGIDADYAVMQLIKDGWVTGVAAQFPAEHGRLAAEAALAALRGEVIAESIEVPKQLVTIDNVEEMSVELWDMEL